MNPVTLLSLGRIAVGVASIAKPDLVAKQMTGQAEDPPVLTQWFGNREIALGLVTLLARGGHRRTLVLAGMAVDAADAGTSYSAMQNGHLPKKLAVPAIAVAGGAVLSGLVGLPGKRTKKGRKKAAATYTRPEELDRGLVAAGILARGCRHERTTSSAPAAGSRPCGWPVRPRRPASR